MGLPSAENVRARMRDEVQPSSEGMCKHCPVRRAAAYDTVNDIVAIDKVQHVTAIYCGFKIIVLLGNWGFTHLHRCQGQTQFLGVSFGCKLVCVDYRLRLLS